MVGKAETLTPLKHLQRKRRSARIFGALLAIGVVTLACFVLAVNDGRNYRRLASWLGVEKYISGYLNDYLPEYLTRPFATPAPPALKSRRTSRVVGISKRLTDPNVSDPETLHVQTRLSAYERCERLATDDAGTPTFQAAGGEWECLFSRELGSAAEPSVLFIQVKGVSSAEFRTFRLKLNRLDPSQNDEIVRLALASIDGFGLEMSPQDRHYMDEHLKNGEKFSARLGDLRVSLDLERDDNRRLNLIIMQKPEMSSCGEDIPSISSGSRMHASLVPTMLACLKLLPRSGPVQAD